ncbi:MAG: chemotaxis protein CheB [Planctomycetota bacterium]
MTRTLRVVVVDHSALTRSLIRDLVSRELDMTVVGDAAGGDAAISLVRKLAPDIVVLGANVRGPGSAEVAQRLMIDVPCPILVTASHNGDEQAAAIEALRFGALRITDLPTAGDPHFAGIIRTMAAVRVVRARGVVPATTATPAVPAIATPMVVQPRTSGEPLIVAIGASTGGPPVLQQLLGALPAGFSNPILVTQHISPGFTAAFAGWLDRVTPLQVQIARDGERLSGGTVLIAPDGHHLGLARGDRVVLSADPPRSGHRPSVDWMMESVAAAAGSRVVAVQLTGMGMDGAVGCRAVADAGGSVLVQLLSTTVVASMPESVLASCPRARQLAVNDLAAELIRLEQGAKGRTDQRT